MRCVGAGHKSLELRAPSVILGSGGFEGNPEMLTHYLGPRARYIRPVARGGYYNKGEGIRMALAAGAAACGDYGSFHAEPLDPRSGATEPVVLVFNYGILVNKNGARFVNEAPATVDATYEAITRIIFEQPDGIAYCILDSRIDDVPNWKRSVRSDQPPVTAATLPELAGKLGIDAGELIATVEAYNAACPSRNVQAARARRLGDETRLHAEEIELGAAHREGAVPRLPDHLRQLLHLRRAEGRYQRTRHQCRRRGDPGSLCRR